MGLGLPVALKEVLRRKVIENEDDRERKQKKWGADGDLPMSKAPCIPILLLFLSSEKNYISLTCIILVSYNIFKNIPVTIQPTAVSFH